MLDPYFSFCSGARSWKKTVDWLNDVDDDEKDDDDSDVNTNWTELNKWNCL